ncbi:MAG: DUF1295 domain-containing protein [Bacteroidales bacterium]|nr:DUF1295 domain-containing protein [Bacteroidales bacterium]
MLPAIHSSIFHDLAAFLVQSGREGVISLTIHWFLIMAAAVIVCFLVSEISRNYSQVDKLWSMMPIIYAGVALVAFPGSGRLWLMAMLVTVWGVRLSYNFSRKGGYNRVPWRGEEDYRWSVLQKNPALQPRWKFAVFNFFFISLYQHLLIMLFCTPMLLAAKHEHAPFNWLDYLAGSLLLLFIVMEMVADNQQFAFHLAKQGRGGKGMKYAGSLEQGFLSEGLWSRMRHPNYTAEQAVWVCLYFVGVAASGQWINPTLIGSVLLILLFIGSAAFTESISQSKYPAYRAYRQKVPRFMPYFKP